ncbi:MAG: DNA-binding protein [Neobacillus sp.]|nr:DNA-binding protein [Neobacillus sp.]
MKNHLLTQARKNKNWTQEELSKMIPCEKTTVSNWENGVSKPSLAVAFKLADLLGQDINYLFSDIKVQDVHTNKEQEVH